MIVTIHLKCETWKKQSAFGNQDIDCFMQIFCILWVVLNMLMGYPRLTQKAFFKPENARINFAVLSVNTLEQFKITDVEMGNAK